MNLSVFNAVVAKRQGHSETILGDDVNIVFAGPGFGVVLFCEYRVEDFAVVC